MGLETRDERNHLDRAPRTLELHSALDATFGEKRRAQRQWTHLVRVAGAATKREGRARHSTVARLSVCPLNERMTFATRLGCARAAFHLHWNLCARSSAFMLRATRNLCVCVCVCVTAIELHWPHTHTQSQRSGHSPCSPFSNDTKDTKAAHNADDGPFAL